MKKIISGIQPSGIVHLGNYIGSIHQWKQYQSKILKESAQTSIKYN